ncbi:MAG: Veg family protein [Clostridia bacterium]
MRKRVFTLNEVKDVISKFNGEYVNLRIHLGRNRFKEVEGKIDCIYPAVFTIVTNENTTQAFSYCDVACGDVKLIRQQI